MLVEAAGRGCVREAALCAALVSGRDLLVRLGREDKHISEARELFEGSAESDFYTLMRAYEFARKNNFSVEACRRYGVHAQIGKQVEQTFQQIVEIAGRLRPADVKNASGDALPRSIMAGFIDQIAKRRDKGTLESELTEGRAGTLMRESVVQEAPLMVASAVSLSPSASPSTSVAGLDAANGSSSAASSRDSGTFCSPAR